MEDKSKRTETVRPQIGECCESQSECDGEISVKSDVNDIELNGETDDEDMEDGETGFDDGSAQVRDVRDPGQPTTNEHQEHMTTHRPCRSRCKFCVMGRGVNSPHRRSDAQDDLEGMLHMSMDYGFLGERESEEQVTLVLVIRARRHKMTWAMLVRERERNFPGLQREQRGSSTILGTTESRSGATASRRLRHRRGKSHKNAKKEARLFPRDQWKKASPMGSSNVQWSSWSARERRRT